MYITDDINNGMNPTDAYSKPILDRKVTRECEYYNIRDRYQAYLETGKQGELKWKRMIVYNMCCIYTNVKELFIGFTNNSQKMMRYHKSESRGLCHHTRTLYTCIYSQIVVYLISILRRYTKHIH